MQFIYTSCVQIWRKPICQCWYQNVGFKRRFSRPEDEKNASSGLKTFLQLRKFRLHIELYATRTERTCAAGREGQIERLGKMVHPNFLAFTVRSFLSFFFFFCFTECRRQSYTLVVLIISKTREFVKRASQPQPLQM